MEYCEINIEIANAEAVLNLLERKVRIFFNSKRIDSTIFINLFLRET